MRRLCGITARKLGRGAALQALLPVGNVLMVVVIELLMVLAVAAGASACDAAGRKPDALQEDGSEHAGGHLGCSRGSSHRSARGPMLVQAPPRCLAVGGYFNRDRG